MSKPDTDQYDFSTPMMRQYLEIKAEFPDCLLFFRLGDFYELFLEDAKIGAQVLSIVLTSRDRGKDGRIPMAGVPYHAADGYLNKLVKAGYKVAICDQISQPDGKNLVERKVTRIVTPGTILSDSALDHKNNNYIISVVRHDGEIGLAVSDLSTGIFYIASIDSDNWQSNFEQYLTKLQPHECIVAPDQFRDEQLLKIFKSYPQMTIHSFSDWLTSQKEAKKKLEKQFKHDYSKLTASLNANTLIAGASLLEYLEYTQKKPLKHITDLLVLDDDEYLSLDRSTINNLELLTTFRDQDKAKSLLYLMDQTSTAMGARLLKTWLLKPLRSIDKIEQRLAVVDYFVQNPQLRKDLAKILAQIGDLERLLAKITMGMNNPKDLISLKSSLRFSLSVTTYLQDISFPFPQLFGTNKQAQLEKLIQLIEQQLVDEPPVDPKQGKLIKTHINPQLDELKKIIQVSKDWITKFEAEQKTKTQIPSLKVRFNQVFGYYIEVSNSHLKKIPTDYQRKQTLVNAERFITTDLKKHEQIILEHQQQIQELEYQIYQQICAAIIRQTFVIQQLSKNLAQLDCLQNFAYLAVSHHYCKPQISSDGQIDILQGRHPVLEKILDDQLFVPNDTHLNQADSQLLVITGPNMAGKSVYLRQVAIITLMAHMGSFVPANQARISLTDHIFVRSGAADMITSGLSTFMVEMVETAAILKQATSQSLIVMDEIGRGTSTYDGISIAWSVAKYLVDQPQVKPKTLFATHYHELQNLVSVYPKRMKNFQVAVTQHQDQLIFLHQLVEGGASHSFGIAVAKLAGLPPQVLVDAQMMLEKLESQKQQTPTEKNHKLSKELKNINIDQLSPLDALNMLSEMVKNAQK